MVWVLSFQPSLVLATMPSRSDRQTKDFVNRNKLIVMLVTVCVAAWALSAIHPVDRQAWWLENILLVLFVGVFALTHRRLQLSNTAYVCIALFILLHIVGAHFTYAKMPLGLWAKHFFGFSRNHFDRVGHFGFGLFLALPIREVLVRFSGTRRAWSFWLAVAGVLAVSGLFEIIESIVAEMIAPGKGVEWLGGQGDEWDAQNDMIAGMLGALAMMAVVALLGRREEQE
jgi:putative membrane protein